MTILSTAKITGVKQNPDSERNIKRIDKPKSGSGGSTHGFQVHFKRDGKTYQKFFSDSKYDGKEAAREQARIYRDKVEPYVPAKKNPREDNRNTNNKNKRNKTGVIGIHYRRRKRVDGSESFYVVAVASPAPLKQIKKEFLVGNRSVDEVIAEANRWRHGVLEERAHKAKEDKTAWRNALDDLIARGEKHLQHGERIRVFLCHSKGDKEYTQDLYNRLLALGCDPWLDEEKLLPGQEWEKEIPRAIRNSHVFLVCLSAGSVTKRGFIQKEIKLAINVAEEIPEGDIFIVPIKIQPCDAPDQLSKYQWLEVYNYGYSKLIESLARQAKRLKLLPLHDFEYQIKHSKKPANKPKRPGSQ